MPGDRATVLPKGALDVRIELADTSTIFDDQSSNVTTRIKMEQLRSGLFLRYGLANKVEMGVEVPVIYRYRGFLEGIITQTERLTSGLAPPRKALKSTGFVFNVSRSGQTLFSGSDGQMGVGDTTFFAKYQWLDESNARPAVSFRAAVKAPTGDVARVFGSGHPDTGLGIAVEKRLSDHWLLHGNLNGIFPTGQVAGLTVQPAMSSVVALEYLWSPTVSLVGQFDYYSSPYHGTGSPVLDEGVTEVVVGFLYQLRPNVVWQLYAVENLDFIRGSAADFTLSTVLTYQFGR